MASVSLICAACALFRWSFDAGLVLGIPALALATIVLSVAYLTLVRDVKRRDWRKVAWIAYGAPMMLLEASLFVLVTLL